MLDEKLYENILVYDISYKTSTGPKPLRTRFDKIDGFIRVRGGEFRYLVLLFDYGLFDKICGKIKYLISEKSGITDDNFGKTRIDSNNSLPIEKVLTFHNVMILVKSAVYKNKNEYYYNIFLEKGCIKVNPILDIFKCMFVYYKCYISIELLFLKELMLMEQVYQNSAIFVTIDFS